jgi:hypothetical protein
MYDCQTLDAHGNLGNFPDGNRGTVGTEIYNNNITMALGSNCGWNQFIDVRGGTNMIFNNVLVSKFSVASGNVNFQLREEHCGSGGTCSGNWPDNGTYPCYQQIKDTFIWNNKANDDLLNPRVGSGSDCIQLNRDYWTPASGLDAGKPGTCADNTFYGATDTGKLYKCHPANTWNLYYAPYTYPHPLASGSSPPQPVPGDVNGDGDVDIIDLGLIGAHFGQKNTHPQWNVAADVVVNNEIDVYDVVFIASRFT